MIALHPFTGNSSGSSSVGPTAPSQPESSFSSLDAAQAGYKPAPTSSRLIPSSPELEYQEPACVALRVGLILMVVTRGGGGAAVGRVAQVGRRELTAVLPSDEADAAL